MKIDRVRSLHVSAEWDYHEPLGEAFLSRPVNIYPELAALEPSWPVENVAGGPPYTVQARFLLIDTDDGATGICGQWATKTSPSSSVISPSSSSARTRRPSSASGTRCTATRSMGAKARR